MISSIRKFSKTIYAKIILGIVAIPFIFWGMGSSFTSGTKNVVVKIDKEKFTTKDFVDFIQSYTPVNQKVNSEQIDNLLTTFIGDKLIEKEYENFGIKLSDKSLSKLIKNQKEFKKENKFSRTEYEKFLLNNNYSAVLFENNLSEQEKKKQLLNFIGGGIIPSKFIVNDTYNKINQKRNIQLINLNDIFKKEVKFSEKEILTYFENNIDKYKETYKTIKILEINPKILTDNNDFTDLFFKKIDDIDDSIYEGKNLNQITQEFNLNEAKTLTLNRFGKNTDSELLENFPFDIIEKIFLLDASEPTALIENKNKFFIVELIKTENLQKKLNDKNIKNIVISDLKLRVKRKLVSEIVSKINNKTFKKFNFDKLAKDKNINIQKIRLDNLNDNKILKKEIVYEVYGYPEKKIIALHDIQLKENFLIYIDVIENVSIDENSEDYNKYLKIAKIRITNGLFNTYDKYIKNNYKIDINYNALKTVKNYFN